MMMMTRGDGGASEGGFAWHCPGRARYNFDLGGLCQWRGQGRGVCMYVYVFAMPLHRRVLRHHRPFAPPTQTQHTYPPCMCRV